MKLIWVINTLEEIGDDLSAFVREKRIVIGQFITFLCTFLLKIGLNLQLIFTTYADEGPSKDYGLALLLCWTLAFFLWSGTAICYSFVQNYLNFRD